MTNAHCSFCNTPRGKVTNLVARPNGLHICDECVALCGDIIAEENDAGRKQRIDALQRKDDR